MNHLDEGLAAADAELTHCCETTERRFEAELWRLRGEIIRQRAWPGGPAQPAVVPEAERCLEQASSGARAGARMLERRASRS